MGTHMHARMRARMHGVAVLDLGPSKRMSINIAIHLCSHTFLHICLHACPHTLVYAHVYTHVDAHFYTHTPLHTRRQRYMEVGVQLNQRNPSCTLCDVCVVRCVLHAACCILHGCMLHAAWCMLHAACWDAVCWPHEWCRACWSSEF